jgi:predicted DNA-binding transcriptional regulator AlpA
MAWQMKPRKILRPKETWNKVGCGKTKFEQDYRWHSDNDPDVPGAPGVKRLKPIRLGPRNVGFLEHEIDALIEGLAKKGGHTESKAKNMKAARTTRADSAATLEQKRKDLIERRSKLGAQLSGDPDPDLRTQVDEIDRELRALDSAQK